MILYHMDRAHTLKSGMQLELHKPLELGEEVANSLFMKNFPYGISLHGKSYLPRGCTVMGAAGFIDHQLALNASEVQQKLNNANQRIIELVVELVRQSRFPQMPSRLVSLFTVKSIDEFKAWESLLGKINGNPIYEVEVPYEAREFDARWLRGGYGFGLDNTAMGLYLGVSIDVMYDMAYRYWSGEVSDSPLMECLVPLPVQIGELVKVD